MGFTPSAAAQLMERQGQQPGPLDMYAKAQQILAGRNQLQTQQLQQQGLSLQNQKEQMALDSQKKLMDAISSGAFNKFAGAATPDGSGFDAAGAYQELVTKHGVLPEHAAAATESLLKIGQSMAEQRKTNAQAAEANVAVRSKTLDALAAKLGSIGDMPANKAGDALDAFHQDLVKNPKAYPGLTQEEMAHLYSSELGHLPAVVGYLGLEGKLADFHKSKAEAAKAAQGVIPEGGGLSPEAEQGVKKDIAVATNPLIQKGKEDVAKAEGEARANIESQTARGSSAALAKVPPHLVPPATAAATKAGEEYAAAHAVTQRMNATMDAARKGNVVSYQIIPEEGTLQITTSQGVHRINQTEINQYAGGGSLWQRMEGHFGKALTGKSIPDSVLNDMAEIQKIQAEGSRAKYENSLKTINDTYGASFKPVEMTSTGKESKSKILSPAEWLAQQKKP